MDDTGTETDVLVLGAGIAGLTAAAALKQAGRHVTVVDKGRGVGGRMATRRFDGATFDHGAPFLATVHPPEAIGLAAAQRAGVLLPWDTEVPASHPPMRRWRGQPSMSAIAKHLASGLDVHLETTVTSLRTCGDAWCATTLAGPSITARSVVATAPLPQSLALLDAGHVALDPALRARLESVRYERCLAVMAVLAAPSNIPAPGDLVPTQGPIARLVDNQLKGISAVPSVTLHATHAFSLAHWDEDRDATGRHLLASAEMWLGAPVTSFQVHGWRYSQATVTDPALMTVAGASPLLVLAGDAFGGHGVEGAARSGMAAAARILEG